MKICSTTLPLIKLPNHVTIVIYLLKEEINNRIFVRCFDKSGIDMSACCTDLCELIFSVMEIEDRSDEFFDWYFKRLDHYAHEATSDRESINDFAFRFYVDLEIERRSRLIPNAHEELTDK